MNKSSIRQLFRSSDSLVYVALSMFAKDKDNVLPELLYSFNKDQLLKLISVFGGNEIYIPDPKELQFYCTCAFAGYYLQCQNHSWKWIAKELELDDRTLVKVQENVNSWLKNCSKDEKALLNSIKEYAKF